MCQQPNIEENAKLFYALNTNSTWKSPAQFLNGLKLILVDLPSCPIWTFNPSCPISSAAVTMGAPVAAARDSTAADGGASAAMGPW